MPPSPDATEADAKSRTWPSLELWFADLGVARGDLEDAVASVLDDVQPIAVAEVDGRWVASFASASLRDRARQALAESLGESVVAAAIELPDDNWVARSQSALAPVTAGRILVMPPWHELVIDRTQDPVVILIVPSMGFGTGHHATTRMCLMALQEVPVDRRRVLDIGTGSGVLALAAARLGASMVIAIDNDADALDSARANVELNGLVGRIRLQAADVEDLSLPPQDVVLANLTGGLLQRAAPAIAAAVVPGGRLVVSGFTTSERGVVVAAFGAFSVAWERAEDGWGCVVLAARREGNR